MTVMHTLSHLLTQLGKQYTVMRHDDMWTFAEHHELDEKLKAIIALQTGEQPSPLRLLRIIDLNPDNHRATTVLMTLTTSYVNGGAVGLYTNLVWNNMPPNCDMILEQIREETVKLLPTFTNAYDQVISLLRDHVLEQQFVTALADREEE